MSPDIDQQMRFAFYGRVSTEDQQDPETSRRWQLSRAGALVETEGAIVAEFFDVGQSRSIPWKRRPRAAALLEELARPERGFDAVVIGEPQRASTATSTASPSPCSCTTALACGCRRSVARSTRIPKRITW